MSHIKPIVQVTVSFGGAISCFLIVFLCFVLQWSPHDNTRFVIGKDDLRLYQTVPDSGHWDEGGSSASSVDTARRSFRRIDVIVSAEVPHLRCVEWFPDACEPNLLGVGLHSGKLLLTKFNSWDTGGDITVANRGTLTGDTVQKEFMPKISRPCNAVSWNPVNTNQVAVGLDKVRSDCSTLIWDVNSEPSISSNRTDSAPRRRGEHRGPRTGNLDRPGGPNSFGGKIDRVTKPVCELANSEAVVALSWLPGVCQKINEDWLTS
jgi:hypothetical protein